MESGGNSMSTTGPAMETTLPSFRSPSRWSVRSSAVTLIGRSLRELPPERGTLSHWSCAPPLRSGARSYGSCLLGLAQGLGPAHDLHDLGGDARLAQLVGLDGQVLDQLFRVVGGRLHGPLAGGLLGGGGVEHGGKHAGLDVARDEPLEDGPRLRLVLVIGLRPRLAGLLQLRRVERQQA